jgi:hypothetical protein
MIPFFPPNRRHTEALEKSARAKERAAKAAEKLAQNIGPFFDALERDPSSADAPPSSSKPATPPPLPSKR